MHISSKTVFSEKQKWDTVALIVVDNMSFDEISWCRRWRKYVSISWKKVIFGGVYFVFLSLHFWCVILKLWCDCSCNYHTNIEHCMLSNVLTVLLSDTVCVNIGVIKVNFGYTWSHITSYFFGCVRWTHSVTQRFGNSWVNLNCS